MVSAAQSQVVIFRMEFKNTGTNINYSFYDEGYVVAPAVGGSPTYLFMFRDETGMNKYTKFVDFGEYFVALNRTSRRAVLAADADSEVNLFALQAVGEPNIKLKVDSAGFVAAVETPMTLEGFVLSSDDESELPFDDSVGNLGYAGSSTVKAFLQRDKTDRANEDLQSVAAAVVSLEADLQRRGFTEFVLGEVDEPDPGDGGATPPGTNPGTGTPGTNPQITGGNPGTDGEVVIPAEVVED